MTAAQLIAELQRFPANMVVTFGTPYGDHTRVLEVRAAVPDDHTMGEVCYVELDD
jgi:hypothetical protein